VYPVVGDDLVGALLATPRSVSLPAQPQGESVTFTRDGRALLVSSEGTDSSVLRIPLVSGDGGVVHSLVGEQGSRRPLLVTIVVAAAVLAVAALAFVRRRRRYSRNPYG
jgi:MYXO-CTERM domain-containing protein